MNVAMPRPLLYKKPTCKTCHPTTFYTSNCKICNALGFDGKPCVQFCKNQRCAANNPNYATPDYTQFMKKKMKNRKLHHKTPMALLKSPCNKARIMQRQDCEFQTQRCNCNIRVSSQCFYPQKFRNNYVSHGNTKTTSTQTCPKIFKMPQNYEGYCKSREATENSDISSTCSYELKTTCTICGMDLTNKSMCASNPLYNTNEVSDTLNTMELDTGLQIESQPPSPPNMVRSLNLIKEEVIGLVFFSIILTMALVPMFDAIFRAFLGANDCICKGDGHELGGLLGQPYVMANGLQRGLAYWVTCPFKDLAIVSDVYIR